MRRSFCQLSPGLVLFLLLGVGAVALSMRARAGQPRIEFIERFQTNYVLIHFDTEANRTYELQYTETLTTNGVPAGPWTNLFVTHDDSPNHYVWLDTGTRPQRFYRLHVTP